ncbi:unnamed protein product (macronuclear) [Paramecium tetraurelia]|uniref:Transmembrane protein 138 n=1 Tax=Paramecium tetraurelia TaxID=5888 RepID=A0DUG7_PARTE|nr:uncharacterized protein GSPATT00020356001 [Paramecium tetraurelia]CAK86684.1 unnamed protein product [Paramecium tetraurelia]|eukprot:XP_001454081.1 hypothetical protein (macronuclear) [Paramecium tetraurelia strain d4-2]
MRDLQSELRTLYIKLGIFYVFLIFDLIWSSFIEPTTMNQISQDSKEGSTQILWMSSVHIIITGIIFVLFCTLMWQTQPLKLGMIKLLIRYSCLSIFRDFIYVFAISGLMLIIVVIERVAIFITNTKSNATVVEVIQSNWSSFFYQLFYFIRYLLRPLYIFVMLHGSMKITKPYYHMRNPELFIN